MPKAAIRGSAHRLGALLLMACFGAAALVWARESARADGPDTWTPTAPLVEVRFQSAASLLADGRVLITGGRADFFSYSSQTAEIYDPATNAWSSAAPMPGPRHAHAQLTLTSGKVLVACGFNYIPPPYADPKDAYLYDPASNTWSAAGSNAVAHTNCSAVLLADGRVLVAGGTQTQAAEVYDPSTNSWSSAGTQVLERQAPPIARMAGGDVLLAGGVLTEEGTPVPAEIYDPAANAWTATGSMQFHHFGTQAALLADGRAFIAGGAHHGWPYIGAEIYEPATGEWQGAASMPFKVGPTRLVALANGLVMVNGGQDKDPAAPAVTIPLASTAVYNRALDAWSTLPSMTQARYGHTLTVLSDGRVLSAGGLPAPQSAEVYEMSAIPPPDTPTPTTTPANTLTPTPTWTPSPTPTSTDTPTPADPATDTPTGTLSPTPPPPTPTVTPSPTGTPTAGADNDGDGCADVEELGPVAAYGGLRDPGNHWDFYDVTSSKKVDAIDIALVRANWNPFGPVLSEDEIYDRSLGAAQWAPGPPDNQIDAVDIALVRASFNHSCQAAP